MLRFAQCSNDIKRAGAYTLWFRLIGGNIPRHPNHHITVPSARSAALEARSRFDALEHLRTVHLHFEALELWSILKKEPLKQMLQGLFL